MAWNLVAVLALPGIFAGCVAGFQTVRTFQKNNGRERFWQGIACYYTGMIAYWLGFVFLERLAICIQWGGWSGDELRGHILMLLYFLFYGTLVYGVVLIPVCFLTRRAVWAVYTRNSSVRA